MTVPNPTIRTAVSRRKLIASGATLVAGGGAFAVLGSRRAEAAVDFTIPDETHSGEDGTVDDVTLSADGTYQWSHDGADAIALALAVAPPDTTNWVEIDRLEKDVTREVGQGQFGLSGSVLAHPDWGVPDFSADAGETTTQAVAGRVAFEVLAGGETVAEDSATNTAQVAVENTSTATSISVTADGSIDIQV